ncbi:MAG: phosphodiester glycosidase family protein [Clostridia bacterium]|nr:phosphodiester glycosidase family protein [Clostridia bacterium]
MITKYKRIITAALCVLLLAGTFACGGQNDESTEIVSAATPASVDPDEETVVVSSTAPGNTAGALPDQTPDPTPVPTPITTRPPMEGDVSTDRFPDHDIGGSADYSYQSDELRIAITRHEDEDNRLVYYVADVWIRNINTFRMGIGNGKFNSGREDPEHFAQREHAIFGVSGTMNSGLVIHNGVQIKKNVEKSDIRFRSGVLIIYRDGTVKTINRAKKQTYNYNNENKTHGGVWHALQFGPVLVQNGEIASGLKKNERHPRIIFGYCEPGHYILVAVDGRTKTSIGITEKEMADLMLSLGCTEAMNLDGGNSAVMLFMGKTINTPSGKDKDGDGIAGRNIVDLLMFAEYDAEGNAPDLSNVHADRFNGE